MTRPTALNYATPQPVEPNSTQLFLRDLGIIVAIVLVASLPLLFIAALYLSR
jgi:hypothetical protein